MVKLLLWNIDLTPDLSITNPFRGAKDRYAAIAKVLNQFDIVVLNECFLYRKQLLKLVDHKYRYTDPKPCFKIFNSGVVILSNYPFIAPTYHHFTHNSSWDVFISKGILKMSFNINGGHRFDLYGTHMQQYNDKSAHKARMAQVGEVVNFVRRTNNSGADVILVGDLNMGPVYDKTYRSYPVYYKDSEDAKLRDEQYTALVSQLNLTEYNTTQDICHLLHRGTNLKISAVELPDYKLSDTGAYCLEF